MANTFAWIETLPPFMFDCVDVLTKYLSEKLLPSMWMHRIHADTKKQAVWFVLRLNNKFYARVIKPQLDSFSYTWGASVTYRYDYISRKKKEVQVRVRYVIRRQYAETEEEAPQ